MSTVRPWFLRRTYPHILLGYFQRVYCVIAFAYNFNLVVIIAIHRQVVGVEWTYLPSISRGIWLPPTYTLRFSGVPPFCNRFQILVVSNNRDRSVLDIGGIPFTGFGCLIFGVSGGGSSSKYLAISFPCAIPGNPISLYRIVRPHISLGITDAILSLECGTVHNAPILLGWVTRGARQWLP